MQGYFLAAFLFLGIVFALPVAMGTAALALNLPLSNDEALGGLVLPAASYVILGKGGEQAPELTSFCLIWPTFRPLSRRC